MRRPGVMVPRGGAFILGGLLVGILIVSGCSSADSELPSGSAGPRVAPAPQYTVERGEVVKSIEFTGMVVAVRQQELFFRADGRVRDVLVEEGTLVSVGDVIAELEVDELERELARRRFVLRRAEVNLDIAELNLGLAKSDTERSIGEKEIELARIGFEEASVDTTDLEAVIDEARLVAPFDGLMVRLRVSPGSEVTAFDSVGAVADLAQLELSGEVTPLTARDLEEGLAVTIADPSGPGTTVSGVVRRLPDGGGSTLRVAFADSGASEFELGDRLTVTALMVRRSDVLWLPPEAVRTFGGRDFVLVEDGAGLRTVDVELGVITDSRVEIVAGLTEGQAVMGE